VADESGGRCCVNEGRCHWGETYIFGLARLGLRAVYLTAGAAGMYCGSCMHDNALAKAMRGIGVDCVLQPIYTPIRTDDKSIANHQMFFGGIHIYLLQQFPWLKYLPRPLRRWLDWEPLIRFATRKSAAYDAKQLGELSISMLQGLEGRQADEVDRLSHWLSDQMKPDAIIFTNLLIGGCLPELSRLIPNAQRVVLLQGDDIFLDHLPQAEREMALQLCRSLVPWVDRFVTHSHFYAAKMAALLCIPSERIQVTPLSIDLHPFQAIDHHPLAHGLEKESGEFRLGYFARIAPEKGLHHLVNAFISLANQPEHVNLTLHVAGWLGEHQHDYFEGLRRQINEAGLEERFVYHGSPDLNQKIQLLASYDVTCVPTDYEDPKGLFVLESLAAGTPVILPRHGAFPELIESTSGGILFAPGELGELIDAIVSFKSNESLQNSLAHQGRSAVLEKHSIQQCASAMKFICFADRIPDQAS